MIVVVKLIAASGGLMRDALTRRECQLVSMLRMNKDLPSGVTGFYLKT